MKRLLTFVLLALFTLPVFAQDNTVKIYLAPQIGSGTFLDPFRSKLNNYINVQAGESFDEIDNPARRYSICTVIAQPATHQTIATDPTIIALTPNDVTPAQLQAVLDSPVSSLPSAFRTNVQNALEAKGISFAWVGASNTVRDVFRYLLRVHFFAQRVEGEGNINIFNFIKQNLDTTAKDLTAAQRNAVKNWMDSKGLSTGWITNTTTVRQVIHAIVTDLGFGIIKIGGQDF
jgi:hypothetical protein